MTKKKRLEEILADENTLHDDVLIFGFKPFSGNMYKTKYRPIWAQEYKDVDNDVWDAVTSHYCDFTPNELLILFSASKSSPVPARMAYIIRNGKYDWIVKLEL